MKKLILLSLVFFLLVPIFPGAHSSESYIGWKAGTARVIITPQQPIWMAGYADRDRPSEGKLHDLWAKALAIEDSDGNRSVLVTMDLRGIPKGFSDNIRDQIKTKFGLSRAQIILNVSHTHTGPVLTGVLLDIYPIDSVQAVRVRAYTTQLEGKIVALAGSALQSLEPVQIYSGNGVTRFQVNRRNNNESTLSQQSQLNGPNDYAVPVIKVVNGSGKIVALAFGYACHSTVLSGYKFSGDYPGFAQLELEKAYPGTTALFFQGCGGDQNPLPRRTIALAEQYGKTLAAAVERVLTEDMRNLSPRLTTSYKEIELSLSAPPSKEELLKIAKESSGYENRWAVYLLNKLAKGEPLITSYPYYPLQVWRLGDQTIMTLGGEAVVEYSIRLKQIFGQDIFVLSYSNDRMAYIPSAVILKEGGYEGATSQMVSGLPGPWTPNIETVILGEMSALAEQAGVPKLKPQ